MPKSRHINKKKIWIVLLVLYFILCPLGAYMLGKHNERIIVRAPVPPPITLPPQAIVAADCVTGFGKQYVIPKDIPNGPIYDVQNSKVIAIEYNFKASDIFLNPTRLSNTILPLTQNYKIDRFTTTVGNVTSSSGSINDAQNISVHLIIYLVSQAEGSKITCPAPKTS